MTVRNILVAYNGTETAKGAVRLAILLAKANNAHLTGLFVQMSPAYYANIGAWLPDNTIAMLADRDREYAEKVRDEFYEVCREHGRTDRKSFFVCDGQPNVRFAEYARTYDLVVIGQPDNEYWDGHHQPHPDVVALQSGRPVMVAPRGFDATSLGEGAIVAWDGKRAAARALSDAMDMLETISPITVVYVGDEQTAPRLPGRDIMEHLSRHGIAAEMLVVPRSGRTIGSILLETCTTRGAGLLVMGAYEHSQFSEEIIGGVTKEVLSKANFPILVSH
ncbi:universal stress protein [Rhodobacteraceae bacterium NNCM2]|nr:universal stress protein [Coraliihabitans acroporae]